MISILSTQELVRGPPGDTGVVSFQVWAVGYDDGQAQVKLTIDEQLNLSNQLIGPAPDSIIGNSAFWTIDYPVDYATQGRRRLLYAKFKTLTKTTAQMDSSTIFLVEVVNSESESNTSNNKDRWHVKIGGPYDPNNKLVTPQGLDDDGKNHRGSKHIDLHCEFSKHRKCTGQKCLHHR